MNRGAARAVIALLMGWGIAAINAPAQPLPPPPGASTQPMLSDAPTVEVASFEFEGNRKISTARLTEIAEAELARLGTRRVNTDQLEDIRKALTREYTGDADRPRYINSGVALPDQEVADGVIRFKVIEGTLTKISVMPAETSPGRPGKLRLRESYITSRVRRGVDDPLDLPDLQNQLELLRIDPNLARLNAELRPGDFPGESILNLTVAEAKRYYTALAFHNRRSPSVGAEQFEAYFGARNLSGLADSLSIRYGITQGGFDDMELAGLDDYSIEYAIPVSSSDTTLSVAFTRTSDSVVEDEFADLNIDSDSISASLTLRQPIYRTPTSEFALFATVEYRENETSVDGNDFSFSPGSEDGKQAVFPLRFGQEYTVSQPKWAFAARSTFTLGTDWFTGNNGRRQVDDNGDELPFADAQYFAWLGQVQYVRRLADNGTRLVLRGGAQFADDTLPSIEQFSIGGINSVRGYRENRVVRDQGLTGTVELRVPIWQRGARTILEAIPFADCGFGFNHDSDIEGSRFISSAGIGLAFTPAEWFTADVFYGYPLNKFENRDDLQDLGVHFNIVLSARF